MRKFIVLFAAVLVVAGAWSGAWLYGAGQIRAAVDNLGRSDAAANPGITCGQLSVSGFPFRFDIECADMTIAAEDATTTLAGFRATLLAYNPTQAKLSWLGPITYADAFSGARSRIDFGAAEGSVRLKARDLLAGLTSGEGWRIERLSVVADDVRWTDTIVADRPLMSAAHFEAHLLDIPERHDSAEGTSALAAYAELSDTDATYFGIAGGEARLEAEVSGVPDDLRAFARGEVLSDWQAAGGQLKVLGLNGTAGEEFIESSGTFGLDSGGHLDGQVSLRHKGLVERLAGRIPEGWSNVIFAAQQADGSYTQSLSIKAGVVFSGLVPIMMIPPLT
jgi:hypothetical protein